MITKTDRFWLYAKTFRAAFSLAVQAGFTWEAIEDQAASELRKESERLGIRLHWRTFRAIVKHAANDAMDKALARRIRADYHANAEWFAIEHRFSDGTTFRLVQKIG